MLDVSRAAVDELLELLELEVSEATVELELDELDIVDSEEAELSLEVSEATVELELELELDRLLELELLLRPVMSVNFFRL